MLAERVTTYFESDYMTDVETRPLGRPLVHGLREQLTLGLDPEPSIAVNLLPLLRTSECPAAQVRVRVTVRVRARARVRAS